MLSVPTNQTDFVAISVASHMEPNCFQLSRVNIYITSREILVRLSEKINTPTKRIKVSEKQANSSDPTTGLHKLCCK